MIARAAGLFRRVLAFAAKWGIRLEIACLLVAIGALGGMLFEAFVMVTLLILGVRP